MQYKDYYKILGVARTATQDDIKKAYKKLARKYHPDVSKEVNAEERFKEINEAAEVLKDPEKRAAYDRLGNTWSAGQDFRPPPGWDTGFEFRTRGREGPGPSFSDFFNSLFGAGSPFESTFRRGGRSTGTGGTGPRMPGEDRHARISISLEDAYQGATRQIQLERTEMGADGRPQLRPHTLRVKIPAGIAEGQKIRLPGQGDKGMGGGPAGDLYLEVQFAPHSLYRIEGKDIHLSLPITPWEAALGATIAVPTLGGKVELRIPAGARAGQKLRLKGRGLPGKPTGDQYLELQLATPPADTSAKRKLYEEMARTMPFNPRSHLS